MLLVSWPGLNGLCSGPHQLERPFGDFSHLYSRLPSLFLSPPPRGITTVCLGCDFVMDDSGLDKMAVHLNERQSHRCQVIVENGACLFRICSHSPQTGVPVCV